jgi:hypothetical protein
MSPARKPTAERALEDALKKFEASETGRQIEILAKRVGDMAEQMAVHGERDAQLSKDIAALKTELEVMHAEVTEIKDYANKWRGGFYAIAGLGAGIETIAAFWDRVRLIWAH